LAAARSGVQSAGVPGLPGRRPSAPPPRPAATVPARSDPNRHKEFTMSYTYIAII